MRAFLSEGATVVVPSRSDDRLQQLTDRLEGSATERLIEIVGDMSDTEPAEELRQQILSKVGKLNAVVASLNGRWNEVLFVGKLDVSYAQLEETEGSSA